MHIITRNIRISFHQTLFINKNILNFCKYIVNFLFYNDLLTRKDIQTGPCNKSVINSGFWENLVIIKNSIQSFPCCRAMFSTVVDIKENEASIYAVSFSFELFFMWST